MTRRSPPPAVDDEERLYGQHACRAVFTHREEDVRKLWVDEALLDEVRDLLKACARRGVAYKLVGAEDLEKLTRSTHHEGICLQARRYQAPLLEELELSGEESARILLLENVRDPHNVGAMLRTAAHFGVRAALAVGSTAQRSAALVRTAEGGAESVPLIPVADPLAALAHLKALGFEAVATSSHAARALHAGPLPRRAVILLGAEREGLSEPLLKAADLSVRVEGTGAVESLNVATAAAVLLAEHWREAPRAPAKRPPGRPPRGSSARPRRGR